MTEGDSRMGLETIEELMEELESEDEEMEAQKVKTLGKHALLVDACNGFNELNRRVMLWTVRYKWPAASRFVFNCYRHESMMLVRRQGQDPITMLSREGVTQGEPLSMLVYGLSVAEIARRI